MSDTMKAAVILAAALIVAASLNGGIYETNSGYRINRFTGDVQYMFGGRARMSVPTVAELVKRPSSAPTVAGTELNPKTLKPLASGWIELGGGWWCNPQIDYHQQPQCLRPQDFVPPDAPMATP